MRESNTERNELKKIQKKRRERNHFLKIFTVLACVAVLLTTTILTHTAQALTVKSGEGHHHNDGCYEVQKTLICGQEEGEEHQHTDDCYKSDTVLICGLEESDGAPEPEAAAEEPKTVEAETVKAEAVSPAEEKAAEPAEKKAATEEPATGEKAEPAAEKKAEEPAKEAAPADAAKAEETAPKAEEKTAEETAPKAEEAKTVEAAAPATDAGDAKPAEENAVELSKSIQMFEAVTAKEKVKVNVVAEPETFPVGTTMKVEDVFDEKTIDLISDAAEKKTAENEEISKIQAVNITFLDKEGKEIQPLKPIRVTLASDLVVESENPVIYHVDDKTQPQKPVAEEIKQVDEKELVVVPQENEIVFEADKFSVYAIVGTELKTEITLPGSDGTFEVTVTYGVDAKIPDGASLDVKVIKKDSAKYEATKNKIISAKKTEDKSFSESSFRMEALDITILDKNGNPVEPADGAAVNVSIKMKSLPKGASEEAMYNTMEVQHLNQSSGKTVVETVADVADVKVENGKASAEFTLDSFSTFALTWTDGAATVHWGKIKDDGTFEEFDAASLDTAVGSIDLRASYPGYEYIDAVYYKTEPTVVNIDASTTVNGRTFINDAIKKENATGSTTSYHWLAEDSHNNAQTFTIENGSHIYAVYSEPDPANPHGPTPPHSDDIPTPTTEKTVSTNTNPDGTPDGTYTIELDITGAQISETHQTGANVIIIYDISQSMSQNVGGMTRLEASRRATHTLIDTLKPGTNDIDLALVTFAQDATTRTFNGSNWTKNGANITNVVDGITNVSQNLGTSWHEALLNAYNLTPPDDDPTYVIFITDGCPSVNGLSSNGHSHGAAGTNNTSDLCYTAAVAYSKMIAGTKGTSYSTRVTSGNSEWTISGTGKGEYLYGIYTGTDSNNMLGRLVTASNGSRVITATNETDINNAFKNIAQTIVDHLGATGITTTDGVTELSSISADVHGTAGAFEYYRKGGKNEDGTEKYDHTANNGLGVKWTDAPGAIYNDDGSVTWDLSSVGTAEAEVTYVVRFTVWPSQEAFDILANLNNKVVDYDDLPTDIQNQIYEDNGKYYLKTNTTLNTTYTFKGKTYTDPITFEQGQMVLDETQMNVHKEFANDINKEHIYDQIEFYLLRDGKYYQSDGTVSETLDETKVYKLPVNRGNSWTNSIYIAPGVMKDGEVLETGHKYSLDEKIIVGNEYEYEFTPQTVRPMEINGSLKYLVLVDEYNPAPSGAETYYIDDAAKTYRAATSSDTENVYFVATGANDETLVGTNRKTAELDITKQIVDKTGNFTVEQLDAETFTYRVTLTVPEGADTSGITAYEYVPRTGEGRFTIFGYQSNDKETTQAISSDVSRFSGDTFGAYTVTTNGGGNTLYHVFTTNPDGSKTATIDITLKRNEILRFTNLPANTRYTIIEMYNNYRQADPSKNDDASGSDKPANIADQGYTTTIATKSRNPVTDTVRSGSESGTTVRGTIDYLDVRYYNQFTNTLNDAIDIELQGTKHLDGYEWSRERYYFNLATTNGAPLPIEGAYGRTRFYLTEASGSADKSYSFGKIRFTEAGTYTYTITEDNANTLQVVNGTAVQYGAAETITIVIAESGGKLSVESVSNSSGHTAWDATNKIANTTITNTAPTTEVTATKVWENADGTATPPTGAKVTFTLYQDGTATDQTVELDGTVDENGEAAAWKATFSGLQQYKVVDGAPVAISYTIGETGTWTGYELVTTDPVSSGGTITNKQMVQKVQFIKEDAADPDTKLSGAVFTFSIGNTEYTVTSDANGLMKTANGTNAFELPVSSTAYEMIETTAPDGYAKLTGNVLITSSVNGISAGRSDDSVISYKVDAPTADNPNYVVHITNSSGIELPNAGGFGTIPYTLGGIFLILASAYMYIVRMKRRARN